MSKALKFAVTNASKYIASSCSSSSKLLSSHAQPKRCLSVFNSIFSKSQRSTTLSANKTSPFPMACSIYRQGTPYSTEVDKEISKFLEKEIQFETSRASQSLPKVPGFDVVADGGDLTFTKAVGAEKVVVRLSVNGAVDSIVSESEQKADEPPQMVCKPPFEIEVSKGDGKVLALQCTFPSLDQIEEAQYTGQGQDGDQIDDQFEIQEVAIHEGEWKDTTFSVSAATMDAELFDLLMDMLDERGINDEFIGHLVDYCTSYENQQYVTFLNSLKAFAEK